MTLSVLFSHLETNADMTVHVHEHGVSCHMSPGEGKQFAVSSVNIITSVMVCICKVSLRTVNNCMVYNYSDWATS